MIKCPQGRSSAPRTRFGLHCLNFHPVPNNHLFIVIILLNKIHLNYHIALYNSFPFICLDIDIHQVSFVIVFLDTQCHFPQLSNFSFQTIHHMSNSIFPWFLHNSFLSRVSAVPGRHLTGSEVQSRSKNKAIKSFISRSFSETLGFKTTLADPNPL